MPNPLNIDSRLDGVGGDKIIFQIADALHADW